MTTAKSAAHDVQEFPRLSELRDSPDGVELLNIDGRISFVGGQGMQLLCVSDVADLVGKTWLDFWPKPDRAVMRQRFEMALGGKVQLSCATRGTAQAGAKQWDVTMSPVPNVHGDITSVLAISRALG